MKDLNAIMKQAQVMQQKLQEAQARFAETVIEGSAGNGLVKVSLSGAGVMGAVLIDRSVVDPDDIEMLADLIVAAHADAKRKLEALTSEAMKDVTGGLELPAGLKLPF